MELHPMLRSHFHPKSAPALFYPVLAAHKPLTKHIFLILCNAGSGSLRPTNLLFLVSNGALAGGAAQRLGFLLLLLLLLVCLRQALGICQVVHGDSQEHVQQDV